MRGASNLRILAELRGPWLVPTESDLARIGAPTLLVAGKESPPAFRRITDRIAAAIHGSRVVLVEGGHFVDPGHPDVLEFVDQILGSSRIELTARRPGSQRHPPRAGS